MPAAGGPGLPRGLLRAGESSAGRADWGMRTGQGRHMCDGLLLLLQAMLDADQSNTISFEEFLEGVRRTAASLDDVSRCAASACGLGGGARDHHRAGHSRPARLHPTLLRWCCLAGRSATCWPCCRRRAPPSAPTWTCFGPPTQRTTGGVTPPSPWPGAARSSTCRACEAARAKRKVLLLGLLCRVWAGTATGTWTSASSRASSGTSSRWVGEASTSRAAGRGACHLQQRPDRVLCGSLLPPRRALAGTRRVCWWHTPS